MLQLQYLRWSEHRTATRPQGHCQKPPATQVWTLKECMLICQASPLSLHPNLHPPHHHVGSFLHNLSAVAACHLHPLLSPCLSFSLFPHNANHLCSKGLEKLHIQTHPPLLKNRFHTNLSICNHVHVLIEGQPCRILFSTYRKICEEKEANSRWNPHTSSPNLPPRTSENCKTKLRRWKKN